MDRMDETNALPALNHGSGALLVGEPCGTKAVQRAVEGG